MGTRTETLLTEQNNFGASLAGYNISFLASSVEIAGLKYKLAVLTVKRKLRI